MSNVYDYYPIVMAVINQIATGTTPTNACYENGLDYGTLQRYLRADPRLMELYEDAEQRGYDAMADALVHIDNHPTLGRSDPKMAKVISDNIKWLVARRRPRQYGDKVEVVHSLTADKAIIDALDAARGRALEHLENNTLMIDITPTPISDVGATDAEIMAELLR